MTSRIIKTMKLGTAIKGTDSLLLHKDKFAMEYFPALSVVEVVNIVKEEKFIVPVTNIAYMMPEGESEQKAGKAGRTVKSA
jgi:hypothetical protein